MVGTRPTHELPKVHVGMHGRRRSQEERIDELANVLGIRIRLLECIRQGVEENRLWHVLCGRSSWEVTDVGVDLAITNHVRACSPS